MATVMNDENGSETKIWGTVREAVAAAGCSETTLRKFRDLGLVRCRKLPGMRGLLHLGDCRKIARRVYEDAPGDAN